MKKSRINLYLPKELHKKAKKHAIDLEISLSKYVTDLIKDDLSDDEVPTLELTTK